MADNEIRQSQNYDSDEEYKKNDLPNNEQKFNMTTSKKNVNSILDSKRIKILNTNLDNLVWI